MKTKQRIMAVLMIILLMGTNLITLGNQVIASNLPVQSSKTNNANVMVNAYFANGLQSEKHEIGKDANLYFNIKVSNTGYLKNATINILNANYQIDVNNISDEMVQSATETQLKLKQINSSNDETIIEVPIAIKTSEQIEQNFLEKTSQVLFKAIYIDENGKEREVSKTIETQSIWEAQAELNLTNKVTKYIPYQKGEERGVLVQTMINSELKGHVLPVLKTKLTMQVPKMNDKNPQRVSVLSNKTLSTNNDTTGNKFGSQNYEYNAETGSLIIQTENEVNEEKISWSMQGEDEYLINFVYVGNDVYEQATKNDFIAEMKVQGEVTIPNSEMSTFEKEITVPYQEKEIKGTLSDVNISVDEPITKAYIYANYDKTENKEQTPYKAKYRIQVNDETITDQIQIQTLPQEYVDNQDNEYEVGSNSCIKQIEIQKEIFENILGVEGSIEVSKTDGTLIGKIENENYTIEIENEDISEIVIKTSKPISSGNLDINITQALLEEQNYTKEQMKEISKIKMGAIIQIVDEKTAKTVDVYFEEPVNKAEVSIIEGKQNLSTVIENKDVQIRAVLDTSSTQYALYKNPTLEIELPKEIEKVNIKNVNLLLEDELEIKESKVVSKDGKQVIQVDLEGIQTEYNEQEVALDQNVISKGANVIISTDMTVDQFATNKQEKLVMYYTNENSNLYQDESEQKLAVEDKGITTTDLNLVAPNGVAVTNKMSGYKGENSSTISANGETQEVEILPNSQKQTVTIEGTVTNNYTNPIENVFILGRTPFQGNKNIENSEDLASTFNMPVIQAINVNGIESNKVQIFYSDKAEASKDLINSENNWTNQPEKLNEVKSYLIVITGEVPASTKIGFSYKVELPENLTTNNSVYEMYKVYYDNKTQTAIIGETKNAGIVGLTTGQSPELEIELSANVENNAQVAEEQIVEFTAIVKNVGEKQAQNVVLNIPVPEGTVYTKYNSSTLTYEDNENQKNIQVDIGTIQAKQSSPTKYELKMKQASLGAIEHSVNATATGLEGNVTSNKYTLVKTGAKINMTLAIPRDPETALNKGDTLISTLIIEARENLSNVVITMDIPQGIKINKAIYQDKEGKEQNYVQIQNNQIKVTIPSIEADYIQNVTLELEVDTFTGEFMHIAKAVAQGMEEQTSNQLVYYVGAPRFDITQTSTSERYLKEATEITYKFTIKNVGDSNAHDVVFEDKLPEGLTFKSMKYTYQNDTETVTSTLNNTAVVRWTQFDKGEEAIVQVVAQADILPENKEDKTVVNSATISAQGVSAKETNSITTIIEYNPKLYEGNLGSSGNQLNSNNYGTSNSKYRITGTAWLDSNQNGQREEEEEKLSGIRVMLLQKANNQPVKDIQTGEEKVTTTKQDGTYEFNNLEVGNYIVVFLYDAGKYNVTEYKKANVSQSYNSDAVSMLIKLNGEQVYAGISDTIKIKDELVRDIDLGLYVAEKFDLRLDKYIDKITVTTKTTGTKAYNFNNAKLKKVEILRQDVGASSIVIEYKIVVTNEGQLPGYVKKIIDYLPTGTSFNSELNTDWYVSTSKTEAYNTSLENTILYPGQSKEVKLILSAQVTDKNIGKFINNNAEIYESYNQQGATDIDSTEANKVEGEDDLSKADIILSIVTGKIVIYSTLALTILIMIVISIIIIKRKMLEKKVK